MIRDKVISRKNVRGLFDFGKKGEDVLVIMLQTLRSKKVREGDLQSLNKAKGILCPSSQ